MGIFPEPTARACSYCNRLVIIINNDTFKRYVSYKLGHRVMDIVSCYRDTAFCKPSFAVKQCWTLCKYTTL